MRQTTMTPSVPAQPSHVRRGAWLLCLAVAAASSAGAQNAPGGTRPDSAATNHTVRPGDTLWDLARQYLGDPFQWPEIFRLNPETIEDPHWIYPGEVLRLPGSRPANSGGAGEPPAGTSAPTNPQEPLTPAGFEQPTVFATAAVRQNTAPRGASVAISRGPVVRRGEFEAAPFMVRGAPSAPGRLLQAVDVSSMMSQGALDIRRFQLRERIAITTPGNKPAAVGDLFMVYRMGDGVAGRDVVVPTGVLRVDDVTAGRTATATLVREFESVTIAQRLLPYEPWASDSIIPAPVANGRTTKVLGLYPNELVPSLQNFVFFPLTVRDGVKPGDQLELFREARREGNALLPEIVLAKVTLIRVTDAGATAIVVSQTSSRFEEGTAARIVARVP
jgi:LysM repeat protein